MKSWFWILAIAATILSGCGKSQHDSVTHFDGGLSKFVNSPWWVINTTWRAGQYSEHPLIQYYEAAKIKQLPILFFKDLIEADASIVVKEGEWPSYKPGTFYGGTIYIQRVGYQFTWFKTEWAAFYNELFHAWWDHVFSENDKYKNLRAALFSDTFLNKYKRANPWNPKLALEEAWSETVMLLIPMFGLQHMPQKNGQTLQVYRSHDFFTYQKGMTVNPVSHAERPGYTEEAENVFPDPYEYQWLFYYLTGVWPP